MPTLGEILKPENQKYILENVGEVGFDYVRLYSGPERDRLVLIVGYNKDSKMAEIEDVNAECIGLEAKLSEKFGCQVGVISDAYETQMQRHTFNCDSIVFPIKEPDIEKVNNLFAPEGVKLSMQAINDSYKLKMSFHKRFYEQYREARKTKAQYPGDTPESFATVTFTDAGKGVDKSESHTKDVVPKLSSSDEKPTQVSSSKKLHPNGAAKS